MNSEKDGSGRDKTEGIEGGYAIQQRRQQPPRGNGGNNARGGPDSEQTRPAPDHHRCDFEPACAERQANPELAPALSHRVRDDAVDANAGQYQCSRRKGAEQDRLQPARTERSVDYGCKRTRVVHRLVRIDRPNRRRKGWSHRLDVGSRANDESHPILSSARGRSAGNSGTTALIAQAAAATPRPPPAASIGRISAID
jgi:hypothetical protein